jgi:hypothetical protein
MVKKQKDELRRIQKEITPKLVKQLYAVLEKRSPEKICTMLEALVGLLRNTEVGTNQDVEVSSIILNTYLTTTVCLLGVPAQPGGPAVQNAEGRP